MYNWRLRDTDNSTTSSTLIARLVNEYNKYYAFIARSSVTLPAAMTLSTAIYEKVIYVHAEVGSDSDGNGSPQNPYRTLQGACSNVDNPVTSKTIVVACGRFASDISVNNSLLIADTFGCIVLDTTTSATVSHVGVLANIYTTVGGSWCNCIINANGNDIGWQTTFIKSILLNANKVNQVGDFKPYYYTAMLNCRMRLGRNSPASSARSYVYGCLFVNSVITELIVEASYLNYSFNSDITGVDGFVCDFYDIIEDGGFQSIADCFVDPSHLNFDLKRSVMSNPIFANWLGWTGDSVDFVRVTGNNVQEDSGSWTIDQQTPGRFSLESAVIDNRGQFNQVFTGLATNVFHYATNEISIAPFERFGTPIVIASGSSSLVVSETTMFCVTQDCKINNVVVNRYQNVILEAGTYAVTEHNGVKFFPYNYNSINNYILVRFTNLGRCTSIAANSTLKIGCTYLNQSGSVITISDGTEVAIGGTYICDTANITADGVLLKVFDDEVNNWVAISTHSFQTKYKAGYVVTNKKYQPATNLLDFDGKTMPLTEAFGEYNDVNYLDSLNWQQDFLQFKVYGVVYDFS